MDININPTPSREQQAEKISSEMQIKLPGEGLPFLVRIVALVTLVGGLGIMESVFSEIVKPASASAGFYVLRIVVGITAFAISYLIVAKSRLAIWLYGLITLISIFVNPAVSLLPAILFGYLLYQKKYFQASIVDGWILKAYKYLSDTNWYLPKDKKTPPQNSL